ncbi:MAG: hypothetical protein HZC41_03555 [Chloroflexi bacterium]|nr:hypothetical protein [Chloroflexota bacterium]
MATDTPSNETTNNTSDNLLLLLLAGIGAAAAFIIYQAQRPAPERVVVPPSPPSVPDRPETHPPRGRGPQPPPVLPPVDEPDVVIKAEDREQFQFLYDLYQACRILDGGARVYVPVQAMAAELNRRGSPLPVSELDRTIIALKRKYPSKIKLEEVRGIKGYTVKMNL